LINIEHNSKIRENYLKNFYVKETSFGRVLGSPYTFLYLIEGFLFDASVTAWAYLLVNEISKLEWKKVVFLTHSHYDHLGGIPVLKKFFPDLKVYGHKNIEKVMESKNALEIIRKFDKLDSEEIRKYNKIGEFEFEVFNLDVAFDFSESKELMVDEVLAIYSPGHTKDTVAYYLNKYKALIMAESMGVPNYKFSFVLPEFLTSYNLYVSSYNSLKELVLREKVNNFLLPHILYFESFSDVRDFLKLSEESLELYVRSIINFIDKVNLRKDCDEEEFNKKFTEIFNMMIEKFYVRYELSQPIYGFEANVKAQVKAVLKELV